RRGRQPSRPKSMTCSRRSSISGGRPGSRSQRSGRGRSSASTRTTAGTPRRWWSMGRWFTGALSWPGRGRRLPVTWFRVSGNNWGGTSQTCRPNCFRQPLSILRLGWHHRGALLVDLLLEVLDRLLQHAVNERLLVLGVLFVLVVFLFVLLLG